ncbi:MAG: dTDP-4-dehydrorhamnose 3,5-epimerase family protein [Candidatus Limnocylindrales bacterium]
MPELAVGWHGTTIAGALRRQAAAHADARGAFSELWRDTWTAPFGGERFVQANLSRSRPGVLRGLHAHVRQVDLWTVVDGTGLAALVDLRGLVAGSDGRPPHQLLELEPGDQLYIPRLVAHGFYARSELALVYLVSNEYDGTDELGFAWDDPEVGVAWPDRAPILSERDRANPPLRELIATLRA